MLALTMGANAPDCHRRGGCGYGGGCYSYSYSPCYHGGYVYGGCVTYSYSASYGKAADETDEEFAFCQGERESMLAEGKTRSNTTTSATTNG
jgi:hypothetical protein